MSGGAQARSALRSVLRNIKQHFKGRQGADAVGDMAPYYQYVMTMCRANKDVKESDASKMVQHMRGLAYYLDSLVEKKRLLADVGGDVTRGITPRMRNEDTAKRVGLTMPAYQVEDTDMKKYAEGLGLGGSGIKDPKSEREMLVDLAKKTGGV